MDERVKTYHNGAGGVYYTIFWQKNTFFPSEKDILFPLSRPIFDICSTVHAFYPPPPPLIHCTLYLLNFLNISFFVPCFVPPFFFLFHISPRMAAGDISLPVLHDSSGLEDVLKATSYRMNRGIGQNAKWGPQMKRPRTKTVLPTVLFLVC
jgi:hypothetical protein